MRDPWTDVWAQAGEERACRLGSLAVKRAECGNRDAFAVLYARFADGVHRLRAVEERETFLGLKRGRLEAGQLQSLGTR